MSLGADKGAIVKPSIPILGSSTKGANVQAPILLAMCTAHKSNPQLMAGQPTGRNLRSGEVQHFTDTARRIAAVPSAASVRS